MEDIQRKAKLIAVTLLMYGCATPHVVDVNQLNDKNLSCNEIRMQIKEAKRFEKEARSERTVNGKNVAAAILFWPALLGTYANTEEAIKAAKEREQNLMALYDKKKCQQSDG